MKKSKIDYDKCHFKFKVPTSEEKKELAEKIERGDTENMFIIYSMPDGTDMVVL